LPCGLGEASAHQRAMDSDALQSSVSTNGFQLSDLGKQPSDTLSEQGSDASCMTVSLARCSRASAKRRCRSLMPLSEWSVEEVASWAALTPLPLEVATMLRESAINGQVLESLTEEDMQSIGLDKFGWRRQLFLNRRELCQQMQQEESDMDEADTSTPLSTAHMSSSSCARSRSLSCNTTPTRLENLGGLRSACHNTTSEAAGAIRANAAASTLLETCDASANEAAADSMATGLEKQMPQMQGATGGDAATSMAGAVAAAPTLLESSAARKAAACGAGLHKQMLQTPVLCMKSGKNQQKAQGAVESEQLGCLTAYLVDNSRLLSGLAGLEFHRSPALSDACGHRLAPWGSVVRGNYCGHDWIKVGGHFLPTCLNGVPVLRQLVTRTVISSAQRRVYRTRAASRSPPPQPRPHHDYQGGPAAEERVNAKDAGTSSIMRRTSAMSVWQRATALPQHFRHHSPVLGARRRC